MTDDVSIVAPDGRAVANKLLELARGVGIELTLMQLLKILFFAHGISLAVRDQPLVEDRAEAWQYGPVFPRVYRAFSGAGRAPIRAPAVDKRSGEPYRVALSPDTIEVLKGALDTFGRMPAFKLSDLSHAPGSPWDETFKAHGAYTKIPNDLIRDYYVSAAKRSAAATA